MVLDLDLLLMSFSKYRDVVRNTGLRVILFATKF